MGLQTTAENRQWLCRRDVVWQTVPNSKGGNRESSVAVRRQRRTAHNQRWWRGRKQTMSSLDVCRLIAIGTVWWRFRWCQDQEVERNAVLPRSNSLRADLPLLQASCHCSLRSPFTLPVFSRTSFRAFQVYIEISFQGLPRTAQCAIIANTS